jgi:hypothetical protein
MKRWNSSLEQRTPLKTKAPLRAKKGLNKQSKKQALLEAQWSKVKHERADLLKKKYGYLPCEYCGGIITENETWDGHHNNGRHAGCWELKDCRIVHRLCHDHVTTHNIKNVPDLLK